MGSTAMRRANSSVRSARSVEGEHLRHHAEAVGLVDVDAVAGQEQLLGLAWPELPRVGEVLEPAHAEAGADDVGEDHVVGSDDQVAGPHQHQSGGVDRPVHLGDRDLAEVPPPQRVLEVVVPLLEHAALGADPGGAVHLVRGVVGVVLERRLRAHVVARREHRARSPEDHDAARVVLLGPLERLVELDQQAAVLGVAGLRPVEEDPYDRPVVVGLVLEVLVVAHHAPRRPAGEHPDPSTHGCRVLSQ